MESLSKKLKWVLRYVLLKKFGVVLERDMPFLDRKREIELLAGDYIRKATLELIAYEIKQRKIPGNVAEVGVYKGDFAKVINSLFPDRKLYLFDTFEGFDERDKIIDIQNFFSDAAQDWSGVSIDEVISKMKYKENIIIKKKLLS